MRVLLIGLKKLGRAILLMIVVAVGTIALTRFAPGYFSDLREMDARYAITARSELQGQALQQTSVLATTMRALSCWLHGDLGRSRQYDVPVADLIRPRLLVSLALLAQGLAYGWLLAICAGFFASQGRGPATLAGISFTILLAIPTTAIATLCLFSNTGGPVLVMTLLLAARDFKFLTRMLHSLLKAPHFCYARAQGMRRNRILRVHLLPGILPQLGTLAGLSAVTALSAIVPIEVIFDVPGIGQLAWTAATNRDLPVLIAATLLMAAAMAGIGIFAENLAWNQGHSPMETSA